MEISIGIGSAVYKLNANDNSIDIAIVIPAGIAGIQSIGM
jgi:hypothetical protein